MPLDIITIRTAKPSDKTQKLFDGGGLHLEISPAGGKWWRWRYRFDGKAQQLSLGTFPDVSLKMARERRDDARKLLNSGVNPSVHRKAQKASRGDSNAQSLEVVTREWFAKKSPSWESTYAAGIIARFQNDIFPWLGSRPISDITAPELLTVLRRIEARDANESAHRAKGNLGQVFRYAIATGRCERDPAADLRGALAPVISTHLASTTDPKELGSILRMTYGYKGTPTVVCALRLAPLLFVRPGELRSAEWKDIDLEAAEWRYTVSKTKTDHIVPLARQAVELLRELYRLTGTGRYVFPGGRNATRCMSENAVLAALRRMGIEKDEMSGHGFRAAARTILDEVLGVRVEFIEQQLAHTVKDPLGRAYNRTTHLPQRKAMMQQWADYVDTIRGSVLE
jgi:integrase